MAFYCFLIIPEFWYKIQVSKGEFACELLIYDLTR